MLLSVRDLKVHFSTPHGAVRAVDGISFDLGKSGSLGLVGESGCGKSTTGYGLLRLLPRNGYIAGGQVLLSGVDLLSLPEADLRRLRWDKMAMIFQNAMSALNPVVRIGDQICAALIYHHPMPKAEAMDRAAAIFEKVGVAPSRLNQFPHEFSGGMKQRAVIALALICHPEVVIADEPTTALDVVAQRQVLQVLAELEAEMHLASILISHDISVVGELCKTVGVMYAGELVEYGPTKAVFGEYRHPYTQALLTSLPSLYTPLRTLTSLRGAPPNLIQPPKGCRFAPRCRYAQGLCSDEPPEALNVSPDHTVRCHFAMELDLERRGGMGTNVSR